MSFIKELEYLRIPFQDIQVATKNFTTFIGQGGYGPVYRGELAISGNLTSVAVKRQTDESGQGLKEFLTEINLLTRYKHPNLVSLLGFCQEGHENILIYEYAEHGSFDNYLNTANPLPWRQRLNICVDAARGLDYLHNRVGADHRIIHRDIKSSNILLDGNFKAKIADLGLSKIGRANEKQTFLITVIGGTLGYCDPEYFNSGILTKKSDVYSFGVVLFEALCGRLCIIDLTNRKTHLVPLVRRLYAQGKLNEIMDLDLKDSESVKEFSEIANQCLHDDREGRPSMDVVLKKLEKALELIEYEEACESQRVKEYEEACELQVLDEALGLLELLETYALQDFVEALVLQEMLEAMEAMELRELLETYALQDFVEALVLQEMLEAMEAMELREYEEACESQRVKEYEEACELQVLDEALGLLELLETYALQDFVEALVLQEMLEAMEAMELRMGYGTIKAIHMISDTRRPNYTTIEEIYTKLSSGILLDDRKVWLSVDENGKNQEMISAMKFMPRYLLCGTWYLEDQLTCVFSEVALTYPASKVNVEVKIIPQFLSSNVSYAAYLVCKAAYGNLEDLKGLKYKLNNQSRSYYSYPKYIYEHNWVMIELFQANSLKGDVEFKVLLEEFECVKYKDDVIIQGCVFLPIQKFDDEKIKIEEMENPPTCETGWENLLPRDYEQFIYYSYNSSKIMEKKSRSYVINKTREEVYAILSRGFHIKPGYDVDAWFWITKSNGKKCFMLSAVSIRARRNYDKVKLSSPNESRFESVTEIKSSTKEPNMRFEITSSLLSTNTSYACYLVYKTLSDSVHLVDVETNRFHSGSTKSLLPLQSSYHYGHLHLGRSQTPVVIGPDGDVAEGEGTPGTIINKLPIREPPSKREDGWLEVRLWNFTTHDDSSIQKNYPQGCGDNFHIFHADYDHDLWIYFKFKNHNHELVYLPSLMVQGLEFRPLHIL